MAVIDAVPETEIILAFRGTLDFYVHRGQAVVRAWPRPPSLPRSPAVQASGAIFRQLSKDLSSTYPEVSVVAIATAVDTSYSWKDLLTSAQYGHIFSWA